MKKSIIISVLLVSFFSLKAQELNVRDSAFAEGIVLLYNSAGNYFKEVTGRPIITNSFGEADTIGFRLRYLPKGVTDWQHIGRDGDNNLDIFFKLGEYSTDSIAVAKRLDDLIQIIKAADSTAVFQNDDSYSDTKIKQVNICHGGTGNCGEDDKWRMQLYFHRFSGNEFNVSVSIRAFK